MRANFNSGFVVAEALALTRISRVAFCSLVVVFVAMVGLLLPGQAKSAGLGVSYVGCLSTEVVGCDPTGTGPSDLTWSWLLLNPDGRSAYAVGTGTMASFRRLSDGRLSALGCEISRTRLLSSCSLAPKDSFGGPFAAVSPDGNHVYHAGRFVAVTSFDRQKNGSMKYGGCLAIKGAFGCRRLVNPVVYGLSGVSVSPDSRNIYVHFDHADDGLAIYRQPAKGRLKYQGCLSVSGKHCRRIPNSKFRVGGIYFTPDGRTGFSLSLGHLGVFRRDKKGFLRYQGCIDMWARPRKTRKCRRSPIGPQNTLATMTVGPNGNRLYVISRERGSILTFKILRYGGLKFMDCIGYHGLRGCRPAPGDHLHRPYTIDVSPSGKRIYVSLTDTETVERYNLARGGKLKYHGCISKETESDCQYTDAPGQLALNGLSPDGKYFYFGYGGTWSVFRSGS